MQAPLKVLIVGYWYKKIWKSLGPLHEIDTNGDGIISKDDVKAAMERKFEMQVTDANVECVLDAMDLDGDGTVTVSEAIDGLRKISKSAG